MFFVIASTFVIPIYNSEVWNVMFVVFHSDKETVVSFHLHMNSWKPAVPHVARILSKVYIFAKYDLW